MHLTWFNMTLISLLMSTDNITFNTNFYNDKLVP